VSEDIGYRLRRAREARGLTVDEVADRIRIKKAYVMAMEQGQFDALPSPFYARSYLRTYAHFLGLDASAVLREYREQTSEQGNFERPFSRGWERGTRRPPVREEGGSRQWPLPEREDREPPSWTGKGRAWERESSSYGPERSDNIPYRSTAYPNGQSQEWEEVSRESPPGAGSFSADPALSHSHSSYSTRPLRSLSMSQDVQPRGELEYPMRSADPGDGRALPMVVEERSGEAELVSHLSRRRKSASKEKEGTFGKWYNRFLIAGTVLLIPAALAVGILIWGEDKQPINAGDRTEVSADGSGTDKKEPIVYPTETSKSGPDHFELTQADKIELKIDAESECRIEIREQEVGKKLEEVTLKSGSAPFAYESDKEDLWVELKPSKSVKISVNGKNVGEYKKQKVVHIRLVK
jgi:transcriptional regulator with XRE-family HTH domain